MGPLMVSDAGAVLTEIPTFKEPESDIPDRVKLVTLAEGK